MKASCGENQGIVLCGVTGGVTMIRVTVIINSNKTTFILHLSKDMNHKAAFCTIKDAGEGVHFRDYILYHKTER